MSLNNVKVVKKDGTKEEFNVQKVVVAVNKSAYRALIKFSQKDIDFICHFVEEKVEELGVHEIQIPEMHNIVEGALEKVNPIVAKSYLRCHDQYFVPRPYFYPFVNNDPGTPFHIRCHMSLFFLHTKN